MSTHVTVSTTTAEPDYSVMTTQEVIDALEDQLMANPDLAESLVWEVVARLARAEQQHGLE